MRSAGVLTECTDATVSGELLQNSTAAPDLNRRSRSARWSDATVQGSVTQTLATSLAGRQRIRIGSVGAPNGTVTTDAQVSADLLQSGTAESREDQRMLIGSVN